jgi:hypothetical protein
MTSYNPFCSCSRHNEVHNSDDDFILHEQILNSNLAARGMQRLKVKGDGNCLFYALAQGLMYEMNMDPNTFAYQFETFGLSSNFSVSDFANCLRKICVDQWKSNEHFYSQFVDTQNKSFHKEIKKFSKNGVSDSILGDIVPLTISNTFNIEILIFTSVSNLSQIDIKPTNGSLSQKVIYLAYNQCGMGHYDAAYPRT